MDRFYQVKCVMECDRYARVHEVKWGKPETNTRTATEREREIDRKKGHFVWERKRKQQQKKSPLIKNQSQYNYVALLNHIVIVENLPLVFAHAMHEVFSILMAVNWYVLLGQWQKTINERREKKLDSHANFDHNFFFVITLQNGKQFIADAFE